MRIAKIPFSGGANPFLLHFRRLRSITISSGEISSEDLSLILVEFPELKNLSCVVNFGYIWKMKFDDGVTAKDVKTDMFQDVRCSLESLTINALPGDAVQSLVDSSPNLKDLHFNYDKFAIFVHLLPLRNLSLRILTIDGLDNREPIENCLLHSPLSASLEQLRILFSDWNKKRYGGDIPLGPTINSLANCSNLKVLHLNPTLTSSDSHSFVFL